jgi:aminopeptidase N
MKYSILSFLVILLFFFTVTASAQKRVVARTLEVDSAKRPFDVISYDVELDWRQIFAQKTHNFSGVTHITLRTVAPSSEILLDGGAMHVDSILIDGDKLSVDVQPDASEQLHIPAQMSSVGQEWKLDISYHHIAQDNEGLYFYPAGTFAGLGPAQDSVYTLEDVAYTMSEPLDAHRWMPCMDRPYDKATSKISIRVPSDITAQSNGLLDRVDTNGDGSLTFHWSNDTPISTYLMVADASKFVEWTTVYTRVTDSSQTVPIYNYAWPADFNQTEDKSGFQYNAQWALRNTPSMITAFSKRFGEYPFVKYGMVPVQKFDFGGMEHQTLTTINRSWLRGWSEDGIAHELMHQWFGDKTTCATWADIWLNEGFASYGEAIWEEAQSGAEGYLNVIKNQANGFFNPRSWETSDIPVYDPPIENIFNYPTTYAKGSCVLHMLRRALHSDSAFFNSLRDYSAAFAFQTATTDQFSSFLAGRIGKRSPVDLKQYFKQWIYQGGYPIYDITWASGNNGVLIVKIVQQQTGAPYSMPIRMTESDFARYQSEDLTLIDTARTQIFRLKYLARVGFLDVDTSAIILSRFTIHYDTTLEALAVHTIADAQFKVRKSHDGWDVSFSSAMQNGSLEISDILGRTLVTEPVIAGSNHLVLQSNRLPHGVFWGRLASGEFISTFKIEN